MKYLIVNDIHLKGINSENRIGDYYSDIMTKIKEIISIAKKKKVKAILCGGDLFDIPIISNLIVDELVDLIEDSGITWKIVPGNHEMIGHNWDNSKGSSLAHIFRRSDMIMKFKNFGELSLLQTSGYWIQGFLYYHNIEKDLKEKGLYVNKKIPKQVYKIALIHALITEKSLPTEMHIPYKQLKTDFDVIFVAHNHLPFKNVITEYKGTKFVTLGCVGRRKTDEKDIKSKIAIFDTDTKEIEIIPLKSAKPGNEVFDIEKINKNKAYENDIDKFMNTLTTEKIEELDLLDSLEILAKQCDLESEIKNEVIKRIGEK